MMESGLALTSACLPTIYALLKRKSSFDRLDPTSRKRDNSMSSAVNMVARVNGAAVIDTYALKELDPILQRDGPPDGRIFVKKSFERIDCVV